MRQLDEDSANALKKQRMTQAMKMGLAQKSENG